MVFSYVTVGELSAFVIGWNLILEYVIGTASVARGYSGYLDSLLDSAMAAFYRAHLPLHAPFLAPYPDLTAAGITLLLAALLRCDTLSYPLLVKRMFQGSLLTSPYTSCLHLKVRSYQLLF